MASGGTAVLSGKVTNEELTARAERITRTARRVQSVLNNIFAQPN